MLMSKNLVFLNGELKSSLFIILIFFSFHEHIKISFHTWFSLCLIYKKSNWFVYIFVAKCQFLQIPLTKYVLQSWKLACFIRWTILFETCFLDICPLYLTDTWYRVLSFFIYLFCLWVKISSPMVGKWGTLFKWHGLKRPINSKKHR